MNAFAKRTGYADPKDIGFAMKRQWNNGYRYQLIQKIRTTMTLKNLQRNRVLNFIQLFQLLQLSFPRFQIFIMI